MKNIELNELTVITGNSFTGKTALLNEILKETNRNSKYVNVDSRADIEIDEEFKQWFRFIFDVDFEAGRVSFAQKILSAGLSCKEGELLIVENPEIGLHPKAASRIAKFLVYLVSQRGVRVALETNSTDIVTSICYEVYVSNIYSEKVLFLNKANRDSIEKVFVDGYGKFCNENKELVKYPSGFFDANTKELYALL